MAKGVKTRVKLPKKAAPGDTITIKTLIRHKMESGQRRDKHGKIVPRSIVNRFVADFNGRNVIDVALEPSISTNPYFQFDAVVPESGEFRFAWRDDDGTVYEKTRSISVG